MGNGGDRAGHVLCAVFLTLACLTALPVRTQAQQQAVEPESVCSQFSQPEREACLEGAKLLLDGADANHAGLTIQIRAVSGKLSYHYEAYDSGSMPIRECDRNGILLLPASGQVRLLVTSDDTIYTWKVSALQIGVDMVPGRINEVFITAPPSTANRVEGTLAEDGKGSVTATEIRFIDITDEASARPDLQRLCDG